LGHWVPVNYAITNSKYATLGPAAFARMLAVPPAGTESPVWGLVIFVVGPPGVGDGVSEGVAVGVGEGLGDGVGLGFGVGVGVELGVGLGVGVGPPLDP
jgi:hypothetical protein